MVILTSRDGEFTRKEMALLPVNSGIWPATTWSWWNSLSGGFTSNSKWVESSKDCYIAMENGPVEIVDLPMKNSGIQWNMVVFHSYVSLPEGRLWDINGIWVEFRRAQSRLDEFSCRTSFQCLLVTWLDGHILPVDNLQIGYFQHAMLVDQKVGTSTFI